MEAVLPVVICSLESPLSNLEIICKIMPSSSGLNIKLIVLKEGFYLEANTQSGDLAKGINIPRT